MNSKTNRATGWSILAQTLGAFPLSQRERARVRENALLGNNDAISDS